MRSHWLVVDPAGLPGCRAAERQTHLNTINVSVTT